MSVEVLREQQFCLARYIRDPEANSPPPNIEERRLTIYRELFYNNVEGLLAGNFPVIRKLLSDTVWHALIRAFFRDYRCSTPLFPELAREFIRFLEQRAEARTEHGSDDPAWLPHLAHYEWVELALDLAHADDPPFDSHGDLFDGIPVLSSLVWPLAYDWPVHRLSPAYLPQTSDTPTYLLVQRGSDYKVQFHEISALTFRLLQRFSEAPDLTGREQLQALAIEAQAPDITAFVTQGQVMLEQFRDTSVLLGSRIN